MMRKRLFSLALSLVVAAVGWAQSLKGYEYWMDGDYAARQSVTASQDDVQLQLPTASIGQGVHYFNFRAQGTDEEWSSVYRFLVFVPESSNATVTKLRYWYDSDTQTGGTVDVADDHVAQQFDVSLLAEGVHYLTVRLQNSDGEWSAPTRHFFFVANSGGVVEQMQYWFDDDQQQATTIAVTDNHVVRQFDVSQLAEGVHYLTVRLQNSDGNWSAPTRHFFFHPGDDYGVAAPLIGYRYTFNDQQEYVSIPEQMDYELNNMVLPLPDPLLTASLETGCTYTFSSTEGTLKRQTPMVFSIAFENKNHLWSNSASEAFTVSDEVSHPLTALAMHQPATIGKVQAGDFAALAISATQAKAYYLHTSQPCRMRLYQADGTLLTSLDIEDPSTGYRAALPQGITYAIVYQTLKDATYTADDITVRLLENANFVPEPVISWQNEVLTLSCPMQEATILYDLDGHEPQMVYTAPVPLARNAIINARATRQGYDSSEQVSFTIDSYKVATPGITVANLHIYLSCATAEATIRYTLDGSDPLTAGQVYTEPIAITANCTVKAIATRQHFHDSEVATQEIDVTNLTTAAPQIVREGQKLVVTSLTDGATFHYTLDGTTPTADSPATDRIITPPHNCTVRVVAMKEGELPSPVTDYVVDWMQVEQPSFVFTDGKLTIVCNTPGATIYYEIGNAQPTRSSAVYTAPLTLTDNRTVRALAVAPRFNDSEVGTYQPNAFTCDTPVLAWDGRHLTMTTTTEGATIRYTLDGTVPGNNAAEYSGAITLGELLTVKAVTMKANTNNSAVATLTIEAYYDGEQAMTARVGVLSQAFQWTDANQLTTLTLTGQLNDADMQWLSGQATGLRHLDMSQAQLPGGALTTLTFRGLPVLTLSVPQSAKTAESGLFSECPQLAAITWNPSFRLTDQMLQGLTNPNLLVYARTRGYTPASLTNVVVDGHADQIVLTDAEGNANFYCPQSFVAGRISYTHHYAQQTGQGECRGWETLCLPFDVQRISHATRGAAAPFAADRQQGELPFWLCSLGTGGFENAAAITANMPYIVAMPNHPTYADAYVLAGDVTFEATDATVAATADLHPATRGSMTLTPAFTATAKRDGMLVLNVGEDFEGYAEGSAFLADLERSVRPFQAYVSEQSAAVRVVRIDEMATQGVLDATFSRPAPTATYDLQGRCVSHPGRGLYIRNGRKVFIGRP